MPRKTIDDLSTELANFIQVAATKKDFDGLATKEDIKDMVTKDDLATTVNNMKKEIMKEAAEKIQEVVNEKHEAYDQRINDLEEQLKYEVNQAKVRRLLDALHSRRLNFLVIGVAESLNWDETNDDCRRKIIELFQKMNIPNPELINIVDCHRLGKKPTRVEKITINGKVVTKCRPIIFKVADNFMVKIIKDNANNLKTYFSDHPEEKPVHFKSHIPKEMYDQRSKLQTKFTELFKAKQKPEWKINFNTAKYYIRDSTGKEYHDELL